MGINQWRRIETLQFRPNFGLSIFPFKIIGNYGKASAQKKKEDMDLGEKESAEKPSAATGLYTFVVGITCTM